MLLLLLFPFLTLALRTLAAPPLVPEIPETVLQIAPYEENALAFSPDGQTLGVDFALMDVRTRGIRRLCLDQGYHFIDGVFTPDGQHWLTVGPSLTLWNTCTGIANWTVTGPFNSVAVRKDGRAAAVGAPDGTVRLYDVVTGQETRRFKAHDGPVVSLSFSPDGRLLLTGAEKDKTPALLWNAATGKSVRRVSNIHAPVWNVQFAPDGKQFALVSDGHLVLYDTTTAHALRTLSERINTPSFTYSPNGALIAAIENSSDGFGTSIALFSATKGQRVRVIPTLVPHHLAFAPDGKSLVIAEVGGGLVFRDVTTGLELGDSRRRAAPRPGVISANGRRWAIPDGKSTRIIDPLRALEVASVPASESGGDHPEVALSPDGGLLARSVDSVGVSVTDLAKSQTFTIALPRAKARISALCFSPEGNALAVAANLDEYTHNAAGKGPVVATKRREVIVFDLVTHQVKGTFEALKDTAYDLTFTSDGHRLYAKDLAGELYGFDVGSGIRLWNRSVGDGRTGFGFAVSPDAARIALTKRTSKVIELLDAMTGKSIGSLPTETGFDGITYSRDGKRLFGHLRGVLYALDAVTGKQPPLWRRGGHISYLTQIVLQADGAVWTTGNDGFLILRDAAGNLKATLVATTEGLATLLPDGTYFARRDGLSAIGFRVGTATYPADEFDLYFNRPDVVLTALGCPDVGLIGDYRAAYQKRLERYHITDPQAALRRSRPTLRVTAPVAQHVEGVSVDIAVEASGPAGGRLTALTAYLNDVPVPCVVWGPDLPSGAVWKGVLTVPLTGANDGRNSIQLSARAENGTESFRTALQVVRPKKEAYSNVYVVALGVSDYTDSKNNLKFAAKDARDMAAMWQAQQERFGTVHILLLTDAEVTREALPKIRQFLAPVGTDDLLVLFVAGHGLLDRDANYWFATHDIDFSAPAKRGLSFGDVESLVTGVRPWQKLVLIDTCHAGEADRTWMKTGPLPPGVQEITRGIGGGRSPGREKGQDPFLLSESLFADLRRDSGAVIIAAASGSEFSFEAGGNGVFTRCVLDGLSERKADQNGDGIITVSELRDYVGQRVSELTQGRQTPTARRENLDFDFRLF